MWSTDALLQAAREAQASAEIVAEASELAEIAKGARGFSDRDWRWFNFRCENIRRRIEALRARLQAGGVHEPG